MDDLFTALLEFYEATPALTVAMSQGGDHIGGDPGAIRLKRKAMNSFICSTDRPFKFRGRMNEDVNTYTTLSRQGHLFLTVMAAQLNQSPTQSNDGGITELYKKYGTYVKAFNTVMHSPSCVRIGELGDPGKKRGSAKGVAHYRIHHDIDWNRTAPRILRERHRK
jgi:hypothetical protein